jgi:RNA polymerase sigma factor (sigma-70 family)
MSTLPVQSEAPDGADKDFIRLFNKRMLPGFDHFYLKLHSRLLAFARRLLRGLPESEDIVDESFMAAWTSLHQFDTGTGLEKYLYRTIYYMCLNFRRTLKKQEGAEEDFAALILEDPDMEWLYQVAIEHAGKLKGKKGAIALETLENGSTNKKIAAKYGISTKMVARIKYKAAQQIKKMLGIS